MPADDAIRYPIATVDAVILTIEDDQVKVSAMEAMRLLSSAYSSTGREVKAKLEQMLTLMVSSL